jgi:large subunit ribosomal protein L23
VNPFNVLVRPLLSEKSNRARENENKYHFQVSPDASKADVKKAVEKLFNVKVTGVTTLVTRGKVKARGNRLYKKSNTKKAIVSLPEGAKIPLFEDL